MTSKGSSSWTPNSGASIPKLAKLTPPTTPSRRIRVFVFNQKSRLQIPQTNLARKIIPTIIKNKETILCLRDIVNTATKALREQLIGSIVQAVKDISGGSRLVLYKFHGEQGVEDPATVLIEVDSNTGDLANEPIDVINLGGDNSTFAFSVDTENGSEISHYMKTDELLWLYNELAYIEDAVKFPDWEFTIVDGEIVPKDE